MVLRCKGISQSAEEGESIRISDHELTHNTVILNIELHCGGCIKKLKKFILKFKGVDSVSVDADKDLVIVKGTMDVQELVTYLKAKLKRKVAEIEVVPLNINNDEVVPLEINDKKDRDIIIRDGEEKDKECSPKARSHGNNEDHKKVTGGNNDGGRGGSKEEEVGGEGGGGDNSDGAQIELYDGYRYYICPVESTPLDYMGDFMATHIMRGPQLFSDENPNAYCSIM